MESSSQQEEVGDSHEGEHGGDRRHKMCEGGEVSGVRVTCDRQD